MTPAAVRLVRQRSAATERELSSWRQSDAEFVKMIERREALHGLSRQGEGRAG